MNTLLSSPSSPKQDKCNLLETMSLIPREKKEPKSGLADYCHKIQAEKVLKEYQMWVATLPGCNSLLENHSTIRMPLDCCHFNSYNTKTVSVYQESFCPVTNMIGLTLILALKTDR